MAPALQLSASPMGVAITLVGKGASVGIAPPREPEDRGEPLESFAALLAGTGFDFGRPAPDPGAAAAPDLAATSRRGSGQREDAVADRRPAAREPRVARREERTGDATGSGTTSREDSASERIAREGGAEVARERSASSERGADAPASRDEGAEVEARRGRSAAAADGSSADGASGNDAADDAHAEAPEVGGDGSGPTAEDGSPDAAEAGSPSASRVRSRAAGSVPGASPAATSSKSTTVSEGAVRMPATASPAAGAGAAAEPGSRAATDPVVTSTAPGPASGIGAPKGHAARSGEALAGQSAHGDDSSASAPGADASLDADSSGDPLLDGGVDTAAEDTANRWRLGGFATGGTAGGGDARRLVSTAAGAAEGGLGGSGGGAAASSAGAPSADGSSAPVAAASTQAATRAPAVPATVLPSTPSTAPSWFERIVERMRLMRSPEQIELRLEIEPKGLGQIDVRLRLDGDGLRASIVAEHEQTRALLAHQQHRLEAALAQEDVRLTGFDLGVDDGNQGGSGPDGEGRAAGRRFASLPADGRAAEEPAEPVAPSVGAAGRLSLRV